MNTKAKGRTATARRRKGGVAAHPAFAAILGVWGAMLAGLAVMVLPSELVGAMMIRAGLGAAGAGMQSVAALVAALALGGSLYAVGAALSRKARRTAEPAIVQAAARRMRTIDPARDLGSESLDAPITAMPFAPAPPQQDEEVDGQEHEEHAAPPPPRALDLATFAALPGRNAVWVEEPAGANHPPADEAATAPPPLALATSHAQPQSPRRRQPAPAPVGAAALARLRAVPTEELSLVEMVERFAGALHEHRTAPARPVTGEDAAAREAALAEALRALAALSGKDAPSAEAQPLHDALARLQHLRGAA